MEENENVTEDTEETNEVTETAEETGEIDKEDDENKGDEDKNDEPEAEENEDGGDIEVNETEEVELEDDNKDKEETVETDFQLPVTEEEKPAEGSEQKPMETLLGMSETTEDLSEESEEGEEGEVEEDFGGDEEEGPDELVSEQGSALVKGRSSIYYDMGPRIRDVEIAEIVTGDFLEKEEDIPLRFYGYMDEKDEEEGPEESASEEEEVSIDRKPYYQKYEALMSDITGEKLRNNILQKRLAKFFKRRKMDHVLKETEQQIDTQDKYQKKLDTYGELSSLEHSQRTTITTELETLKAERESKCNELQKMFSDLQIQEKETGYGLIYTKTGKTIPDKLVERLVQRQKQQMHTVADMRLKYIQLKNIVIEKQNAISRLDKIGENLYLMDYEQLKVENRNYMDKMEEKDEELSRLRNKCQKTIQILAHMREKSAALETDIYDLRENLRTLKDNSIGVRGSLNKLKQQRDYYRNMTTKLRDESGLLTQSDLLRDMEVSMTHLKSRSEELEFLKEEHKIKAQQIRNIRKNIEFPPEGLIKRTQKVVSKKAKHGRRLYKGRPSIHKPTLPEDAFKHLRHFRSKPTFDVKKHNKKDE